MSTIPPARTGKEREAKDHDSRKSCRSIVRGPAAGVKKNGGLGAALGTSTAEKPSDASPEEVSTLVTGGSGTARAAGRNLG